MLLYPSYNEDNKLINVFNTKRRSLCPFEEAQELQNLYNGGLTQTDIARMFRMSQGIVSAKLALNKLSFLAKRVILNGQMPVSAGYLLGGLSQDIQNDVVKEALAEKGRASRNDIKKIVTRR